MIKNRLAVKDGVMKKALIVFISILVIISIAAVSVNFIAQKEADNYYVVSFCSEMTKTLMKNPSSYEMIDYEYEVTELPDYMVTKKINDMPKQIKELMSKGLVKFDLQKVSINYVAKNSLEHNNNGYSVCYFDRDYNFGADSIRRIYPYYFKINNKIVSDDVIFYSYITSRSKGFPSAYERKLNYLIYKIFK